MDPLSSVTDLNPLQRLSTGGRGHDGRAESTDAANHPRN